MDRPDPEETSRKRLKVSQDQDVSSTPELSTDTINSQTPQIECLPNRSSKSPEDLQKMKETEVGITHFVSPDLPGFSGTLKKRYTDFLVNEIVPSGEILHLRSLAPPPDPFKKLQKEDLSKPSTVSAGSASNPAPTPEQPIKEQPSVEQPRGEIEKDGPQDTTEAPKKVASEGAEFQLSPEDNTLLETYFGTETVQKILALHKQVLLPRKSRSGKLGQVKSAPISDRSLRTGIHQAIRTIFSSRLESSTSGDEAMVISEGSARSSSQGQGRGQGQGQKKNAKSSWEELGGDYLHFTIYKENKDTMEIISYVARQMKINPKFFQFAGTKDRRGVTVQRASAHRVHANRLAGMNRGLRNASLGDFEYRKQGLELGELGGNEFVITLRDCGFPGFDTKVDKNAAARASEVVSQSLNSLREKGYFNYYGLQRFGTFSTRTDTIGIKMLKGDFKGACESILHFSPESLAAAQDGAESSEVPGTLVSTEDKARAVAIDMFQTTDNVKEALYTLPRKFSAESNIMRHLGSHKNDYLGAMKTIPRNLRLMYVHAYQSLVWNCAVGERWDLFGDKVVEGDLVIVQDHKDKEVEAEELDDVDEDGEVIVRPNVEDRAPIANEDFTRARALTAEEAASGNYSLFDVVLPLPGFDIIYPSNAMTDFYRRFMASERGGGLDLYDMRRNWKDVSLSGSYRKILSRPGPDYSFEVRRYAKDDEQFVQTDYDLLKGNPKQDTNTTDEAAEPADKLAVIIKLQLGSSQYATMALRELMKTGGVKTYKPDFGGGR